MDILGDSYEHCTLSWLQLFTCLCKRQIGLTKLATARVPIILRTFWVTRQLSLIISK